MKSWYFENVIKNLYLLLDSTPYYIHLLYGILVFTFFLIIIRRLGWVTFSLGFLRLLKILRLSSIAWGCLHCLIIASIVVFYFPEQKSILAVILLYVSVPVFFATLLLIFIKPKG